MYHAWMLVWSFGVFWLTQMFFGLLMFVLEPWVASPETSEVHFVDVVKTYSLNMPLAYRVLTPL